MVNNIEAIVINTIKYGDNSLIFRCYTKKFGLKCFFLRNRFNKVIVNKSFFIPLSQVFITTFLQKKNNLMVIKEIHSSFFYKSLYSHPSKIALVIFLSEFLNIILKEDLPNLNFFNYLINFFNQLDKKKKYFSDFHLLFILRLTKFLGFYPNTDNIEKFYFDLKNGVFISNFFNLNTHLSKENSSLLKELINLDFSRENYTKKYFKKNQRVSLLNILLNYYQLQYFGFKKPKSLIIFSEIF